MSQFRWNWGTEIYTKQLNVETVLSDKNYPASVSYIDVSAFERVSFTIHAGIIGADTVVCQVKQDTSATQTASIKNVTGATVSLVNGSDNTDFNIEIDTSFLDSANGFWFLTLAVSGTGTDYAAIVFHGYAARSKPVTQPAGFPSANRVSIVTG